MALTVTVERDPARLEELVTAWMALADRELEPNPFFEPWFLVPALRHLDGMEHAAVILVSEGRTLLGVLPVLLDALGAATPIYRARMLRHLYSMDHTPLLDRDRAEEVFRAALGALAEMRAPALELDHVRSDGHFGELVASFTAPGGLPTFVQSAHERALFLPASDAHAYLERALSPKRRKELARRERTLGRLGVLALPELRPGDRTDPEATIDAFLALEAAGWKGQARTALASDARHRIFFEEVIRGGVRAGRVWMQSVTLDEAPIAMLCSFVSGRGAFSWKIAYDERYAKHSPGLFVEVVNLRRLHERPEIEWMDSCASPQHPLIDRLWPDRRAFESRWIATGGTAGRLFVQLMPLARRVSQGVRRLARNQHKRVA